MTAPVLSLEEAVKLAARWRGEGKKIVAVSGSFDILHAGQSQFTDLVGGKPLGLTIAWINRRQVPLDASVPRPDFSLADIQSLADLVEL